MQKPYDRSVRDWKFGNLHYYYVLCVSEKNWKELWQKTARWNWLEIEVAAAIKDYIPHDDVMDILVAPY